MSLAVQACGATGTDLEGRALDPLAEHAAATVLVFVTTECPISNQYASELQQLALRYGEQRARFWLVYPSQLDDATRIRAHRATYGYDLPALRDPEHQLAHRAHAKVTPSAAVFTRQGELAYSGRIDDRFVAFGIKKTVASVHDLERALQAVLSQRPVEVATTRAVGCAISD